MGVYEHCFKEMKHTFFLMLNLKYKPLFAEVGPYSGTSFLLGGGGGGGGAYALSHEETGLALRMALIYPQRQEAGGHAG